MPHHDDNTCRAAAEQINQTRPQWLVLWGTYTHRFWAYPLFDMQLRMLVHATYPDALTDRMDDAEHRYRIHRRTIWDYLGCFDAQPDTHTDTEPSVDAATIIATLTGQAATPS